MRELGNCTEKRKVQFTWICLDYTWIEEVAEAAFFVPELCITWIILCTGLDRPLHTAKIEPNSDVLGDGRIYPKDWSDIPKGLVGYTTKQFGNGIHTSMYKVRTRAREKDN